MDVKIPVIEINENSYDNTNINFHPQFELKLSLLPPSICHFINILYINLLRTTAFLFLLFEQMPFCFSFKVC